MAEVAGDGGAKGGDGDATHGPEVAVASGKRERGSGENDAIAIHSLPPQPTPCVSSDWHVWSTADNPSLSGLAIEAEPAPARAPRCYQLFVTGEEDGYPISGDPMGANAAQNTGLAVTATRPGFNQAASLSMKGLEEAKARMAKLRQSLGEEKSHLAHFCQRRTHEQ